MKSRVTVQKFLNYIDEITQFGRVRMGGDEILATFAWEQGFNRVQTEKLRPALERRGIL